MHDVGNHTHTLHYSWVLCVFMPRHPISSSITFDQFSCGRTALGRCQCGGTAPWKQGGLGSFGGPGEAIDQGGWESCAKGVSDSIEMVKFFRLSSLSRGQPFQLAGFIPHRPADVGVANGSIIVPAALLTCGKQNVDGPRSLNICGFCSHVCFYPPFTPELEGNTNLLFFLCVMAKR